MSTASRHKNNANNHNNRVERSNREAWETSSSISTCSNSKYLEEDTFIERYLRIADMTFSILPNGGTGDCLFKAISQAIFDEDESEHCPIREKIVSYIVEKTWDKYQISVQLQHINGKSDLQKAWEENPTGAYKNYMLKTGNLGSFSELNAAGELFQFNFVTIQEYNNNLGMTYRVENSKQFNKHRVPTHYFLFTGDFDNGHWEFLTQISNGSVGLPDGTYGGNIEVAIDNQISSIEFWLMENTQIGQQFCDDIPQTAYLRKRSICPFDCPELRFEHDKTVDLIDIRFVITQTKHSDLFSVLSTCHLRNENLARDMHDILTTHRVSNFAALNYKLITQPHSHGFTVEALKYVSQSYKGNVQDLLSAADLYEFSFTIYMILSDRLHACKFVHVDRWGTEVNKMEHFFLKVLPYEEQNPNSNRTKFKSHWFHLVPVKAVNLLNFNDLPDSNNSSSSSGRSLLNGIAIDCEKIAETISLDNKKFIKRKAKTMYNLYFDRQINGLSDDGDSSKGKLKAKGSTSFTESSGSVPNTKKRRNRSKIEIVNSNCILNEMTTLTAKMFPSDNSGFQPRISSNKLYNSKTKTIITENAMKKISSLEMGMTPSALLSLRKLSDMNCNSNQETTAVDTTTTPEVHNEQSSKSKVILRCSSKNSPVVTQSGSDLVNTSLDVNNEFNCNDVLRRKSDAELLLRRKSRNESWSQRASSFFRLSNVCSKADRVITPISENDSWSSCSSITLCASDESESSKENIQNLSVQPVEPKLSVLTMCSDHEKPFMGIIVEERMRKESADDRVESLYTLRSDFNSEDENQAEDIRNLKVLASTHRTCLQFIFKRRLELLSHGKDKDNEKLWVKSNVDPVVHPVVGVTLPELIWSRLPLIDKNKTAFEGPRRSYTYAELFKYSRSFAASLKHAGFKRNDILAIASFNIPEYPIICLGALEAGLTITLVNNMSMPYEMDRHLKHSRSVCVVTVPPLLDTIKTIVATTPKISHIIVVGDRCEGCHSFYEMIKTDSTGMEFLKGSQINTADSILKITYSSGTSGVPKGVLLTHSNVITNMIQLNNKAVRSWSSAEERIEERFVAILPFFHTYSFLTIMTTGMYQGVHTYCIPKIEQQAFISAIKHHKPTVLHLTTPLFAFILKTTEIGDADLKNVKSITAGATPVTKKMVHNVLLKANHYVFLQEGYGMTELSPVAMALRPSSENKKIGSVGQVLPGTVAKIVDIDTGATVGPNHRGELWIKGPQIMKGYKDGLAETKAIIDPDGFLHTGDLAYYDEDRHFYIVDRVKELIKCKAFQVSPAEIENLLKDYDGVADAAVIGVPDERNQEIPRAYIVKSNPNLTTAEIHQYINPLLTSYKRLKGGIEFVEAIPKNSTGKILKRILREKYLKEHAIK